MPRALPAVLVVLLVACSTTPRRAQHAPGAADSTVIVYVVRRQWHVDIGFAATDLQPPLDRVRAGLPDARFVLFGFGDRHYLLDQDRGPGGMLAALWPGPGLLLVTGLAPTVQAAFGEANVIELRVSADQSRAAQAFIGASLAAGDGPLRAGPYEDSLYYSATVRYSAVHTCNTWAAETLRAADLPVRSAGVELAGQLWSQVRRLGVLQRDPSRPR